MIIGITVLTAISVVLIVSFYVYPVSGNALYAIYIFDFLVVVLLAVDFYKRFKESNEGIKFILKHCYELPSMIPFFGIIETQPILGATVRGLRLIRLFRLLQVFSRTIRVFEGRSNNKLIYMFIFSSMAIIAGALAMYFIEFNVKDSKITNIGDAFWWAIATVTTVGYGDVYSVTAEGRIIAVFFMLLGIAIIGVVISTLGATVMERRLFKSHRGMKDSAKAVIKEKIDSLEMVDKAELSELVTSITTLYGTIAESEVSLLLCSRCSHTNPHRSIYCNIWGSQLR